LKSDKKYKVKRGKNMKRKFIAMFMAMVIAGGSLTGCASSSPSPQNSSAPAASQDGGGQAALPEKSELDERWHPAKPVTLKWVSWEYNQDHELKYLEESLARYKELQPDITIEYEYIASDQYQTWLQTQLVGGTAPDLFLVRHTWGQQYLRDGTVYDLTDVLLNEENPYNPGGKWIDTFEPSVIVQVKDLTNNKYASVPTNGVIVKMFYNKELLAKAGIDGPPETFAELLSDCKTLQDDGIMPYVVGMKVPEGGGFHWYERLFMDPLTDQFNEEMDLNGTGLIEVNEIARAVDKGVIDITKSPWKDIYPMIKEFSQYWHPGYNAMNNDEALEQFARGEVAMTFAVGINAAALAANPDLKFEFGVTEFPTITKESSPHSSGIPYEIGGAPQGNICIPATLKDEDKLRAAIDFLQFKTGVEDCSLYVDRLWGVVPIKGITSDNPMIAGLQFKNGVSPLKLYETYFDKKFWDDSTMLGQLYLQDKLSLEEYTQALQDDLVTAKDAYVQKEGWSDENNWGDKQD